MISLAASTMLQAQKGKTFELKSPDSKIALHIEAGDKLLWSVQHGGQQIIAPSAISLTLQEGAVLGDGAVIHSAQTKNVNTEFAAFGYKKAHVPDQYNQLTLNCKGDYGVIFRAYNDGVAYRFFTIKKGDIIVKSEEASFNFTEDHNAFIPIQWDYRDGKIFNSSFEALYHEIKLSQFPKDSLAFCPCWLMWGNIKKQ